MIRCVCPSPTLDVTYRVDRVQYGASHYVADTSWRAGSKPINFHNQSVTTVPEALHICSELEVQGDPTRAGYSTTAGIACASADGVDLHGAPPGTSALTVATVVVDVTGEFDDDVCARQLQTLHIEEL